MLSNIKLGTQYGWGERVVEIDGILSPVAVSARDVASGDSVQVPVGELRTLKKEPAKQFAQISQADWDEAKGKALILLPLLDRHRVRRKDILAASNQLGVTMRQVQRYLKKLRMRPLVSTLVKETGGRPVGIRLLDDRVEQVITHCIQKYYLKPERCSVAHVIARVEHLCRRAKLPLPSKNSVCRRIERLDQFEVKARRHGRKTARETLTPMTGSLSPTRPLEVVQVDHTRVDLMIVSDDEYREVLGRPWLTVAIDVYTRCIVGIYLTMDPPSALSVAICVANVVLPKEPWLKELGLTCKWEMYGRPMKLHTDNAAEFRGTAMARGCEELGIILEHRPVGLPNWGGHVERLIGTMMRWFHCLPGTTFSNTHQKGDEYSSEGRACMTLREAQEWLITEICTRYHNSVHRGIGMTPTRAWEKGFAMQAGRSLPVIADPLEVLVSFLPMERRKVVNYGILLFGSRYWNSALANLIGVKTPTCVYYDPRDMSQVYVRDSLGRVVVANTLEASMGHISLYEMRRSRRRRAVDGKSGINTVILDKGIEANEARVAQAQQATRSARRLKSLEDERQRAIRQGPIVLATPAAPVEASSEPLDPWAPLDELPVEQWEGSTRG